MEQLKNNLVYFFQGNEVNTYLGHADRVTSVCGSKAGAIVTASLDKTLKLWHPPKEDASSDDVTSEQTRASPTHNNEISAMYIGKVASLTVAVTASRFEHNIKLTLLITFIQQTL